MEKSRKEDGLGSEERVEEKQGQGQEGACRVTKGEAEKNEVHTEHQRPPLFERLQVVVPSNEQ
jgi:hypothetical protein